MQGETSPSLVRPIGNNVPVLTTNVTRKNTIEIVVVGLIFLVLSLNVVLGTLSAVAFLGLVGLLSVLNRFQLHKVILDSWFIFLLPAFCILSTLWSGYPTTTIYFAIQFLITIYAAVLIVHMVRFDHLVLGAFIGLAVYVLIAVPLGRFVPVGADGEIAFAGLAGSKNQSADITLLAILFILTAILTAKGKQRVPTWIFGLLALAAGLFSLALSKATSAIIFAIISVPMLIVLMVFARTKPAVRGISVLTVAFFALLLSLTAPFWLNEALTTALSLVQKDVTLTGRTILWESAGKLISERPLFGVGYAGFWRIENSDAQFLWDAMDVEQGAPFNFHNTPLDLMVNVGIVGMLLFFLPLIYCILKNIGNFIYRPNHLVILSLSVLVSTLPRAGLEVIGAAPLNVNTLVFFMALAYGPILAAKVSPSTRSI